MSETSVVIFQKASQMLAEADTIQKAKELKSLALTAADWARRKGMGEEAIQYAKSYALEAERKMGEMLKQTERNTGAQGIGTSAVPSSDRTPPTIYSPGVSKRTSHQAQTIAAMVAARLANFKHGGDRKSDQGPNSDFDVSLKQSAELLNVGRATVADAKLIEGEKLQPLDDGGVNSEGHGLFVHDGFIV